MDCEVYLDPVGSLDVVGLEESLGEAVLEVSSVAVVDLEQVNIDRQLVTLDEGLETCLDCHEEVRSCSLQGTWDAFDLDLEDRADRVGFVDLDLVVVDVA